MSFALWFSLNYSAEEMARKGHEHLLHLAYRAGWKEGVNFAVEMIDEPGAKVKDTLKILRNESA